MKTVLRFKKLKIKNKTVLRLSERMVMTFCFLRQVQFESSAQ